MGAIHATSRYFGASPGTDWRIAGPAEGGNRRGTVDLRGRGVSDTAAQLDAGPVELLGGAVDVTDALTGFSPTRGLANIGSPEFANHFLLSFTDVRAANATGADLVFFDARFSPDRYEIAVRPVDGSFTAFRTFETDDFIDTGVGGPVVPPADRPDLFSALFGLPLELDDFGLALGTVVDAIQFRSLPLFPSIPDSRPQGDPVMAAELNAHPVPEPGSLMVWALCMMGAMAFARRSRIRTRRLFVCGDGREMYPHRG